MGGDEGVWRCRCRRASICARRSAWAYSQERETLALAATASKVTCWPVASICRSVVTARWRACSARRRAAAAMWRELSARIGGLRGIGAAGLKLADHAVQVRRDLLVHFAHAGLAG